MTKSNMWTIATRVCIAASRVCVPQQMPCRRVCSSPLHLLRPFLEPHRIQGKSDATNPSQPLPTLNVNGRTFGTDVETITFLGIVTFGQSCAALKQCSKPLILGIYVGEATHSVG